MKTLFPFLFLIGVCLFSCKKEQIDQNQVYDSIIVHTESIRENFGAWILISDDNGNLLGDHPITNNSMREVQYQLPASGNIHVSLFELEKLNASTQGTNEYYGITHTNVTDSILYFKGRPNELPSNYENVFVDFDDNTGELEDVIVSSGLTFQAKHLDDFNQFMLTSIRVPNSDPNIFVAELKSDEDFWRYQIIPTDGISSLSILESDLTNQATNSHFETDFDTKQWSLNINGIKEIDEVPYTWNLHWNQGVDSENSPFNEYTYITEPNIISSLNEFSRYCVVSTLHDTENSIFYTKKKVGELDLSFNPTPISFQISTIDEEHIKVDNFGPYVYFRAIWYKSTELPNGAFARGSWLVNGEFDEDFKLPKLPFFALNSLPEELTSSPLLLAEITGFEDSRYSTYFEFQQVNLYNPSVDNSNFSDDVTIKGTTIDF